MNKNLVENYTIEQAFKELNENINEDVITERVNGEVSVLTVTKADLERLLDGLCEDEIYEDNDGDIVLPIYGDIEYLAPYVENENDSIDIVIDGKAYAEKFDIVVYEGGEDYDFNHKPLTKDDVRLNAAKENNSKYVDYEFDPEALAYFNKFVYDLIDKHFNADSDDDRVHNDPLITPVWKWYSNGSDDYD